MILSKNAIGNLINRYKVILKKCSLLNVFGTLAVAGLMLTGGVNIAEAQDIKITGSDSEDLSNAFDNTVDGNTIAYASDVFGTTFLNNAATIDIDAKNITLDGGLNNGGKATIIGGTSRDSSLFKAKDDSNFILKNMEFGTVSFVANDYLKGGGLVWVDSFGGSASIGDLYGNILGKSESRISITFGLVMQGGGLIGASTSGGNASIGDLESNTFGANESEIIVRFNKVDTQGGGLIGVSSDAGSATIGTLKSNNFGNNKNKIGVTLNANIQGGGLIGAYASGGSATIGNLKSNTFGKNESEINITSGNNIHGGGLIGAYSSSSAATIGNLESNTFGESNDKISVTSRIDIQGGGLIGVHSEAAAAKIGNIDGNIFGKNENEIIITFDDNIQGGGMIGAYSSGDSATIGTLKSNIFGKNESKISVTSGSNIQGGGLIGAYSHENTAKIGNLESNTFGTNESEINVTFGKNIQGGGLIGVYSATAAATIGNLDGNIFGISGDKISVTSDEYISGGGLIGAYSSGDAAKIGNLDVNTFGATTVMVRIISGGGLIGAYSYGDAAQIGNLNGNTFGATTVMAPQIFGGGLIGAYSASGSANPTTLGIISNNTFGATTVTATAEILGGGLIGTSSDTGSGKFTGSATIGNINDNSFTGATTIEASDIKGGGLIGAYSYASADFSGTTKLGNISGNKFTGTTTVTAVDIIGGGMIGASSLYNNAIIGNLDGNTFTGATTVTATRYIQGGGLIGAYSSGDSAIIGNLEDNIFTDATMATGYIKGGGLIGAYSYADYATIGNISTTSVTNAIVKASAGDVWGGLVYVQNTAQNGEGMTITNSQFTNNKVTASGTVFGMVSFDTSNTISSNEQKVTLTATNGMSTEFSNNLANGTSNSLFFGNIFTNSTLGESHVDASLNISPASNGTVILNDPIKVEMDNNKKFTMNVDGAGKFIWGGENNLNATGGSTVNFSNGVVKLKGYTANKEFILQSTNSSVLNVNISGGTVSMTGNAKIMADTVNLSNTGSLTTTALNVNSSLSDNVGLNTKTLAMASNSKLIIIGDGKDTADLVTQNGTFTVSVGGLIFGEATNPLITNSGTVTDKLVSRVAKGITVAKGNWTLKDVNASVTDSFNISGGTATLKGELKIGAASAVVVGGLATDTAVLDITKASISSTVDDGIKISSGGTLLATYTQFADPNGKTQHTIFDTNLTGGYAVLSGKEKYTFADLDMVNTQFGSAMIGDSKTLVSFTNARLDGNIDTQENLDKLTSGGLIGTNLNATNDNRTIGNKKKQNIGVESVNLGTGKLKIKNDSTLTVVGNITIGGDLTLGDTSNKAGTLTLADFGNAETDPAKGIVNSGITNVGNGASLINSNGEYIISGDIKKTNTGSLDLNVMGGTLSAKSVDVDKLYLVGTLTSTDSGNIKIAAISTDLNGSINSAKDIIATNLDLMKKTDGVLNLTAQGNISAANITATSVRAKSLTATGAVTLNGGTFNLAENSTAKSLNFTGVTSGDVKGKLIIKTDSALNGGTKATFADLNMGANHLSIGSDALNTKGGDEIIISKLTSTGDLLVDPNWGQISSHLVVSNTSSDGSATDATIKHMGNSGIGKNAMASFGAIDKTWLKTHLNYATKNAGLTHNGINSALGIQKSYTIATGKALIVDGSKNSSALSTAFGSNANTADFTAGSLLVVDGDATKNTSQGAIHFANGRGTLKVAATAKLHISNVKNSEKYTIVTGIASSNITSGGWEGANLDVSFDNIFFDGKLDVTYATKVIVTIEQLAASSVLSGIDSSLGGLVDKANTAGIISVNSPNAGGRAIALASLLPADQRAIVIEGATKIGLGAGVISNIGDVGGASAVNANVRTSLASADMDKAVAVNFDGENVTVSGLSGKNGMQNGLGLWMMPMYQNHSASGFESGTFEYGYTTDIYGISLGADYTLANNLRLGAAFHIGAGNSNSKGDFAGTDNKFNYYGFSLYSGYHVGNLGISADLGYTVTNSDVDQDSVIGNFSADIDAQLFTAGLRAEYIFATNAVDIIPHMGVRVNSLHVNGYDTDFQGGVAFMTDDVQSTTVQFPLGVTLSKTITTASGWEFSPSADLGVMFTAGGTSIEQDVRISGVAGSANMNSDVYDVTTFQGGLGINMSNNNFSLGLNYQLNASEHVTSHGVFGTLRYEF